MAATCRATRASRIHWPHSLCQPVALAPVADSRNGSAGRRWRSRRRPPGRWPPARPAMPSSANTDRLPSGLWPTSRCSPGAPAHAGSAARGRRVDEAGKTRPAPAHHTPQQAEGHQPSTSSPAEVPGHGIAADLGADDRADDGQRQRPVEQARGQVPDADRRAAAAGVSGMAGGGARISEPQPYPTRRRRGLPRKAKGFHRPGNGHRRVT
jgi:hypothetical protein